jgi:hypothetical protein|tara:strand:- start:334 stop:441 length:108 start_codon:yes stop_codon:yes gene_type:complete
MQDEEGNFSYFVRRCVEQLRYIGDHAISAAVGRAT